MDSLFILAFCFGNLLLLVKLIGKKLVNIPVGYDSFTCYALMAFGAGGYIFLLLLPAFLTIMSFVMASVLALAIFFYFRGYKRYKQQKSK